MDNLQQTRLHLIFGWQPLTLGEEQISSGKYQPIKIVPNGTNPCSEKCISKHFLSSSSGIGLNEFFCKLDLLQIFFEFENYEAVRKFQSNIFNMNSCWFIYQIKYMEYLVARIRNKHVLTWSHEIYKKSNIIELTKFILDKENYKRKH